MFGTKKITYFFQEIFLTVFYSGNFFVAPGTAGSIVSCIFILLLIIYQKVSSLVLGIVAVVITLVAIPVIDAYEKRTKVHDSKSIVIDEFIGVLLTCIIVMQCTKNIYVLILGLVLFRFFDIVKPLFIGHADKNIQGGLGVMLDDILAGICAGICTVLIFYIGRYLGII